MDRLETDNIGRDKKNYKNTMSTHQTAITALSQTSSCLPVHGRPTKYAALDAHYGKLLDSAEI